MPLTPFQLPAGRKLEIFSSSATAGDNYFTINNNQTDLLISRIVNSTLAKSLNLSIIDSTGVGALTKQVGLHIASLTKGSTANVDILIGSNAIAPASDYSIYNENTDDSYFAGDIGIGVVAPLSALHVHNISSYAKKQLTISDTSGGTQKPGLNLRVDTTNLWQLYADNADSNKFKLEYNETTAVFTATSGGNILIGSTTDVEGQLQVIKASIGVTASDVNGLNLVNPTAAAAGAQQYSPQVHWTGYGWKTDATAASQSVEFRSYIQPVQGAAAPTGLLVFESSINAGAYTSRFSIDTAGKGIITNLQVTGLTNSSFVKTDGSSNLTASSGLIDLGTEVQNTLPVGNGGFGTSSYTQGDIFYASGTTTITSLAKNASATRYLSNTGGSNNPAWAQITLTNGVTGTLPIGNGGSNNTSFTSGQITYFDGTKIATSTTLSHNGSSALTISDTVLPYLMARNSVTSDEAYITGNELVGNSTTFTIRNVYASSKVSIAASSNTLAFFGATGAVLSTGWAVTNKTTDTTLDCNGTLDQVADCLGTLIDKLIGHGLISA